MILIAIIVAFVILAIASMTDLHNREVPDYLSYGLIFIAFAIAIIYSIINWEYAYLAQSIMGFIIGLILAYTMFYLGQWGGGDSKLIMGLGAIIGFNIFPLFNIQAFGDANYWLIILLVNIIFFGAIYGLAWSIFLAIKNRKSFSKNLESKMKMREIIIARRILMVFMAAMLLLILTVIPNEYKMFLAGFTAMLYMLFYIWIFVKIVEESCMIKDVPISKLTEGDWIYKNVYVEKKLITGPKDLGISIEQIELLKKHSAKGKIKTVTVKEGIPFVPAFLIAFIATIVLYYVGFLGLF